MERNLSAPTMTLADVEERSARLGEVVSQLTGGQDNPWGVLKAMLGAWQQSEDGNILLGRIWTDIRFKARNDLGANVVQIFLDMGRDEYTLRLLRVTLREHEILKEYEGVYADDLKRLFEEATGLDLTLPRIMDSSIGETSWH